MSVAGRVVKDQVLSKDLTVQARKSMSLHSVFCYYFYYIHVHSKFNMNYSGTSKNGLPLLRNLRNKDKSPRSRISHYTIIITIV